MSFLLWWWLAKFIERDFVKVALPSKLFWSGYFGWRSQKMGRELKFF